jgi:hypothetical protein
VFRVIFHLDMDAFYASVEQRDDPALRGKPVIVGAPPTQRGVVCASSYEARKFGVRSALPSATAKRLCPQGIFVRPRMDHYQEESRHIMQIVGGTGAVFEQMSIDEAYLDLSTLCQAEDQDTALLKSLPLAQNLKQRMMSAAAWKNARSANAILPAGQVTPGPKVWTGEGNPNAIPFEEWIPESKWTDGMREIAVFARRMGEKVLSRVISVKCCATPHHLAAASYGSGGELVFNKFRLGADWFEHGITEDVVRLLIHEFGHEYSPDHLSAEYHEGLCRIGAKLFALERRGGS